MIFKRSTIIGMIAAVSVGGMVMAASHGNGDAEAAVKARKAQMQLFSFNLGLLGKMAKGEVEYDAASAQHAADNLVALSSMIDTTSYWVEGSDNMSVEDTRLLPAAFDMADDFLAKEKAVGDASAAMAAAAGTLDGVRASIGDVGGACGACHKAYRAPES